MLRPLDTVARGHLFPPSENWAFLGIEAQDSPSFSIRHQTVGPGMGPWSRMSLGKCMLSVCLSLVNGLENARSFWQAWMRFFLHNSWKAQFSLVTHCLQVHDIVLKNLWDHKGPFIGHLISWHS
jgi:hypothetical protein